MKIKLLSTGDEQGLPFSHCACDAYNRARLNKMSQCQSAVAKFTIGINVTCIDTDIEQFSSKLTVH